ncbi:MAG: ATP-dependent helicase, partial [Ignavibacteriae bacterium]|nr:ATP-dependent helicase [Ignavibacteriota bacterium]
KSRVENKMLISNMASTGDDNILNTDDKDLDYRKIQLKKLKEEVVDLEDLREGVSITDLGLNDFRIDLSNYIKTYGELRNIPEGLHALTESNHLIEKGVIYILKNVNSSVNIDKMNRLHPYYIVYIKENGKLIHSHLDGKKTLDILRMLCKGKNEPLLKVCKDFERETKDFRNMSTYSTLLQKSINSILQTEEEKEVLSLFKSGGTKMGKNHIKGIEDFKLISFIVVK